MYGFSTITHILVALLEPAMIDRFTNGYKI
jgi:hypothetical protein